MNNPTDAYFWFSLVDDVETGALMTVIEQGIDSRLEGFTDSKFEWCYHLTNGETLTGQEVRDRQKAKIVPTAAIVAVKLHGYIATPHEFQVLIRRLVELSEDDYFTEDARDQIAQLADDMVSVCYQIDLETGEPLEED